MAIASLHSRLVPDLTAADLHALDAVSLGQCRLRANALRRLRKAGYKTLGDIARVSPATLMLTRKIGPGTVIVLQERILSVLARPARPVTLSPGRKPAEIQREARRPVLPLTDQRDRLRLAAVPMSALDLDAGVRTILAPLNCATALELAEVALGRFLGLRGASVPLAEEIRRLLRLQLDGVAAALGLAASGIARTPAPPAQPPVTRATPEAVAARNLIPYPVKVRLEDRRITSLSRLDQPTTAALERRSVFTLAHVAQRPRAEIEAVVTPEALDALTDAITGQYRAVIANTPRDRLRPGQFAGFQAWIRPDATPVPEVRERGPLLVLSASERALLATYPWPAGIAGPGQSLADLADREADTIVDLSGFDQARIEGLVALMKNLIARDLPYHEAGKTAHTRTVPSIRSTPVEAAIATPAGSGLERRAIAATVPSRPQIPPLTLTPTERAVLASYPCLQSGTGVDAILCALHVHGTKTLADAAECPESELRAAAGKRPDQIERLHAYLRTVAERGIAYVGPLSQHPIPAPVIRRLAAVPLAALAVPETARVRLAQLGCHTLCDLARHQIADLAHLAEADHWIERARQRITALRWIAEIASPETQRLAATEYQNFLAWMDPALPRPPARERAGENVRAVLERRRLDAVALDLGAMRTLGDQRILTLAHVVDVPPSLIATLTSTGTVETLRGLITAHLRRILPQATQARLATDQSKQVHAWLVAEGGTISSLPPAEPVLALTATERARLSTYPCTATEIGPLAGLVRLKPELATLADVADCPREAIEILTGFGLGRIRKLIGYLRMVTESGTDYVAPLPRHPVPKAMLNALARIGLDEFGIPGEARAWLADHACRTLSDVVRLSPKALAELPEAAAWTARIRTEVAVVRWGLDDDPLDPDRVDAHVYEPFAAWIDKDVEKPVRVPVPLVPITDPDLRQVWAQIPIQDLAGFRLALLKGLVQEGYGTLLALAEADIAALLRVPGIGGVRIADLKLAIETQHEALAEAVTRARRQAERARDDADWENAAPGRVPDAVMLAATPESEPREAGIRASGHGLASAPADAADAEPDAGLRAFMNLHILRDLTDLLAIEAELQDRAAAEGQFLAVSRRLRALLEAEGERVGHAMGYPVWQRLADGPVEDDPALRRAFATEPEWDMAVEAAKAALADEPEPETLSPTDAEIDALWATELTATPWERGQPARWTDIAA